MICCGRAESDHAAAMQSSAGAKVDHIVGAANGFFVMLHHQHGIAQIAQMLQRLQQPVIVAMVQADRRLVEHIQHAAQLGADLRRQADALAFTAGKRRRRAIKRNIAQSDGMEKL